MRLLFVSHSAELAGAERALIELSREACRRGHEVHIVLPSDGPLSSALRHVGVTAVTTTPLHRWMSRRGRGLVGILRLLQCLTDLPRLALAMHAIRPDVVVVNSSVVPAPMFIGYLRRLPTLVVIRESLVTNPTLQSAISKRRIVSLINGWATTTVAVSAFVASQCAAPHVIHSPVRPIARSSRTGTERTLNAVYLGSISADKRPGDAVDAVDLAVGRGADIRLRIYGAGDKRDVEQLTQRIQAASASEQIIYCGEADGPASALAEADLLLMTSMNEAFGRVTIEALMAGVPVVGYDTGGTHEILIGGGGVLVPPSSIELAEALGRIWSDRGEMSRLRVQAQEAGSRWASAHAERQMLDLVETLDAAVPTGG